MLGPSCATAGPMCRCTATWPSSPGRRWRPRMARLTCCPAGRPVRISRWRACGRDWAATAPACSMSRFASGGRYKMPNPTDPSLCSGRTCPEPLAAKTDGISPPSYRPSWEPPSLFPRSGGGAVWQRETPRSPHGGYWMPGSSGCPSAGRVFLSSVLEPEAQIPPKYWLSAKACAGILARADRRGKVLPEALRAALESATPCSKSEPEQA